MIASSLFHFTNNLETIVKILFSRKFRASYNIEDVSDFHSTKKYIAIPVCYCWSPDQQHF